MALVVAAPTSAKCTASAQPSPSTSVRSPEEVEKSRGCQKRAGAAKSKATSSARKSPKRASGNSPIAESDDEERFGNDTLDILEERQLRRGVWFDIENRRSILVERRDRQPPPRRARLLLRAIATGAGTGAAGIAGTAASSAAVPSSVSGSNWTPRSSSPSSATTVTGPGVVSGTIATATGCVSTAVTTGVISVAFGGVLATLSLLRAVRVVAGGGGDVGGFGCAWRCPGGESGNVPPARDTPECKRREEYAESEGNYCCCRRRYLRICYFLG